MALRQDILTAGRRRHDNEFWAGLAADFCGNL
jgi:hypothetical protein